MSEEIKTNAAEIEAYFDRLWPIMRSITGEGVRRTHDILSEIVPLERIEIPTGTNVHDWVVPKEWLVREAYVIDPAGNRILDIADNNLHLINYSIPFQGVVSRQELDEHLVSIPHMPQAVPYATSYYNPKWGFCIRHDERQKLADGYYRVVIDTDLIDGSMTLSHAVLPGREKKEILFSTYTCHPSMANNELSGPLVAAFLYRRLAQLKDRRYTYRFVFVPETIGAIAYLDLHGKEMAKNIVAGYVLSCVGDPAGFTYKKSQRGDTLADRAAEAVLSQASNGEPRLIDYSPWGSDERQYCSPGYDFPVGTLSRSIFGDFEEYHTSLDNKDFVSFDAHAGSVEACLNLCQTLEANRRYRNLVMYGEPQLGRRDLYPKGNERTPLSDFNRALFWLLNQSNGERDLLDIAARSGYPVSLLDEVARNCLREKLLEPAD